jgi:hypothetical protein
MRMKASRIQAGWGEFLGGFAWEHAATLTFDPKRGANRSDASVSREVFRWCGKVGRLSRKPVGWAYAVEGGGGGSLHAHALLIGLRDTAWAAAQAAWTARSGRIVTRLVDDPARAARYMCKQIGPNGEVVFSDTLSRYPRLLNVDIRR